MKNIILLVILIIISAKSWANFLPKTFEANFEQVTKSLRGQKISPVKVFYKFQSNIYFEVTGDTPVTYICNKDKVWIYNPPFIEGEPGELKVGDSSKYCYSKFFDTLSKGLTANKLYNVKSKKNEVILTFSKDVSEQLSINKVEILLKSEVSKNTTFKDVISMKIFKMSERNPVVLNLKNIKSNVQIDNSKFLFVPPKNTNIKSIN